MSLTILNLQDFLNTLHLFFLGELPQADESPAVRVHVPVVTYILSCSFNRMYHHGIAKWLRQE